MRRTGRLLMIPWWSLFYWRKKQGGGSGSPFEEGDGKSSLYSATNFATKNPMHPLSCLTKVPIQDDILHRHKVTDSTRIPRCSVFFFFFPTSQQLATHQNFKTELELFPVPGALTPDSYKARPVTDWIATGDGIFRIPCCAFPTFMRRSLHLMSVV